MHGQILRKAKRYFRETKAPAADTDQQQLPEWCSDERCVWIGVAEEEVPGPSKAERGSADISAGGARGGAPPDCLRDVLGLLREPASSSGGGERADKDACGAYFRRNVPCTLWGSLRVWQDDLQLRGGEWLRKAGPTNSARDPSPSGSNPRGCSAFLRSRRRQRASRGDVMTPPPVVAGKGAAAAAARGLGGEGRGSCVGAERRVLVALASDCTVVSFCLSVAGEGVEVQSEPDEACVVSGAGSKTGGVVWAGSTEGCWISREEAMWRLGAWMQWMKCTNRR